MRDAVGRPQSILVLGGTSEIGRAIVEALDSEQLRCVILACRDVEAGHQAARQFAREGLEVDVVAFDICDVADHGALLDEVTRRHGDLDVVIMAAGVLADSDALREDPVAAAQIATVDFAAPVAALTATAQCLRRQGHGTIVVLSSVAGRRVRARLAVYGAAKAGLDGFAEALSDDLIGSGVDVVIVRPGFVATAMTAGLPPAPFATDAATVAAATAQAIRARRRVVYVPRILGPVMAAMRFLPAPLWRRIAERG